MAGVCSERRAADLLLAQPALAGHVKDIDIMGGAMDVPENIRVPGFTDSNSNTVSE